MSIQLVEIAPKKKWYVFHYLTEAQMIAALDQKSIEGFKYEDWSPTKDDWCILLSKME